jgi:hypothetical protein
MPKIEYGRDLQRLAEIKSELETLKVERMNAFIDDEQSKVDYYTSRIAELTSEMENINGLEH